MPSIHGARVLILATNGFEESELTVPRDRLREAGARVEIASPDGRPIRGWRHGDWGATVDVDLRIGEADVRVYDALVLPGGQINPDLLRIDEDAMRAIRGMLERGQIVAAICHAPWLLVEADALRGRAATSYRSIRKDVENAGGLWVDRDVVSDGGVITSRSPDDLPAFVRRIVKEVLEARRRRVEAA